MVQGEHPFKIIDKEIYQNFKEAITLENYRRLIPDVESVDDAVKIYQKIYSKTKQKLFKVYIFEIERITDYKEVQ